MRLIRTADFRRPMLYAAGLGVMLASTLFSCALLATGNISALPFVVRIAPPVGMCLAVVLMLFGGFRPASGRDNKS